MSEFTGCASQTQHTTPERFSRCLKLKAEFLATNCALQKSLPRFCPRRHLCTSVQAISDEVCVLPTLELSADLGVVLELIPHLSLPFRHLRHHDAPLPLRLPHHGRPTAPRRRANLVDLQHSVLVNCLVVHPQLHGADSVRQVMYDQPVQADFT